MRLTLFDGHNSQGILDLILKQSLDFHACECNKLTMQNVRGNVKLCLEIFIQNLRNIVFSDL